MKRHQWRLKAFGANSGIIIGVALGCTGLIGGSRGSAQQPTVATHGQADASMDALLARRVTIRLTNVSLKRAIDSLSRVARVFVEYQLPVLRERPEPITVNATEIPLGVVLEQMLSGTGLRVIGGVQGSLAIVAALDSQMDSIPSIGTVSGRVVDSATGKGISGATVKLAGTKFTGVTTDSGTFTLKSVPTGDRVLAVRVFGYRPTERSVTVTDGARTIMRIALTPAPNVLSGVVTTASGQIRKVEVGSDITTLNADSIMQVAPIHSLTDLLETRVPGLVVQHTSGVPGDPSRLRLRGAGSVRLNNDPIVIVDGIRVYANQSDIRNDNLAPTYSTGARGSNPNTASGYAAPSPLDQIDPNSIKTVEVFKGPSASALYGSDAANGVIVITTKRGQAGPTHWDLALSAGVNWLPGDWPENYYRFGTYTQNSTYGLCSWANRFCKTDSIVPYQALNDSRYSVFDHGSDQDASLTISGGVPTMQYSLSGSASGNVGYLKMPESEQERIATAFGSVPQYLVRPDNYKTWGVSGSLSTMPSPALHVTIQSSLFNGAQQRSSLENAIPSLASEYISATDSVFSAVSGVTSLATTSLISNDVMRITDKSLKSANTLSLDWQPWTWLPVRATGGINTEQRTDESYIPFGYGNNQVNGRKCADSNTCDTTGYYGLGRGSEHDQTLSLSTTIPAFQQRVTLAVGGSVYQTSTADFQVYTSQLSPGVSRPSTFNCPPNSVECGNASQATSDASTYGWYVEPRLNVASRFFMAPGFRLDGGSGGTHRTSSGGGLGGLSAFPKLNFSYLAVDRQDHPPLLGVISQLRPRIAFGVAGTQPTPQMRLRMLNPTPNPIVDLNDSTQVPVVFIGPLGNTQLHPERSTELEGGFDATLWQDRLTLTYTEYRKMRHDAIQNIPTAPSLGQFSDNYGVVGGSTSGVNKNIGDVRNTGREITLTVIPLQQHEFTWTVNANLTQDKNLVVTLNPGQKPICVGASGGVLTACSQRITPGYPITSTWARPIVSYADANQDGIIESEEIRLADSAVYIGQEAPNYQLNLATDMSLLDGRLSVHGTFAYTNGLTQFDQASRAGDAFTLLPNTPGTTFATQAAVMASQCFVYACTGSIGAGSIIGLVQTVNTFQFRDLSVNYQVPKSISTWFRTSRMAVTMQGSNLGLHTNYRGKDPNVNAFSTGSGEATLDSGQLPEPRMWRLRISLGN